MKTNDHNEQGYLLYMASLGMLVVLAMLMFISVTLHDNSKNRAQQWAYHGMAMNMAEAGFVETLSWLRRNPNASRLGDDSARVFEFLDYCSDPSHSENRTNIIDDPYFRRDPLTCTGNHSWSTPASLNPYIGIVKEIPLSSDLYGRFEVWDDDLEDVTLNGDLWKVRSVGILCRKKTATTNFHGVLGNLLVAGESDPAVIADKGDVEILSSVLMATEFRKMHIQLPVDSLLISANRGDWIKLNDRVRLIGPGNIGSVVQYLPSTGTGSTTGTVQIQGFHELRPDFEGQAFPDISDESNNPRPLTTFDIFGVDKKTLNALSDISVISFEDLPKPLPEMELVFLDGNAEFTTDIPLKGSGVLFVNGNITITGIGHTYSGLICTTGTFTNNAVTTFYGAIVAGLELPDDSSLTAISLSGQGADFSEFYYDPIKLQDVATRLGVYRMSRSPYVMASETMTAKGVKTTPYTWQYGFDREGDKNKNAAARRWLPAEYP